MPKSITKSKPPIGNRFQHGVSGNPNGRPKKIATGAERIERALDALLEKALEKALGGDLHALDIILRFFTRKDLAK